MKKWRQLRIGFLRTGVYTYTIMGRGAAPPEFTKMQRKSGAYAIAVVELDNEQKNKVNVQLTDCDPFKIKIGTRVTAVFRIIYEQEDVRRYGLKFRPELKNPKSTLFSYYECEK